MRVLVKSFCGMALFLVLLVASSATAQADDQVRAVRVSNVVGTVQVLNGTETQFSQAYPNMPLMQGSTLRTAEDGRAEIQFEDGSLVRLTPNTSVTLGVLSRTAEGNTKTEVDLQTGLSYVEMRGTANQRLVVRFGNNEVISPAPVSFRVKLDSNPVQFAVLDGSAHLSNGTAYSIDVKANETVRFDMNDGARYFLAQGIDSDSWDQWNSDRDQALSQMAARETREARGSSNPNDPSWSDLDYYGNWYSSGNGASVWAPNGVGAGWDPYGSGSWGFYGGGGGGYSWISGYPWGWLPYHCGLWNYYNSFGWGWSPGGCGSVWLPVNGIGYASPGYRRVPRPNPIRGPVHVGTATTSTRLATNHSIIHVDRGPEATKISPFSGSAPKTIALKGGEPAKLMAKSTAVGNPFSSRPVATLSSRPSFGAGAPGQPGGVAVFRPAAPVSTANRGGGASSFGGHVSSGATHASGFSAAPTSSGMSAASSSHAGVSSGGGGGGGGHGK